MTDIELLFQSPSLFPTKIDWSRGVMRFIPMSPDTYRDSIFLDARALSTADEIYELRLDDVFLAAALYRQRSTYLHYIFHTTFCCSTLLARCFESLNDCIVLKEPLLLTDLAVDAASGTESNQEVLSLAIRLLTRTYGSGSRVVIKAHEPCNCLAANLLASDCRATATFLITPLRQFVLSVLKSRFRRTWVRSRIPMAAEACEFYPLMNTSTASLADSEAAAYLWLVNRYICEQLLRQIGKERVLVVNGDHLASQPRQLLPTIARQCSLKLTEAEIMLMQESSSLQKYSKDLSRSFCAASRQKEFEALEKQWGDEADLGLQWALNTGIDCSLPAAGI